MRNHPRQIQGGLPYTREQVDQAMQDGRHRQVFAMLSANRSRLHKLYNSNTFTGRGMLAVDQKVATARAGVIEEYSLRILEAKNMVISEKNKK